MVKKNNGNGDLKLSLNDHSEIMAANERLRVLGTNLEAHKAELGQLGIRSRQCGSDVTRYLSNRAAARPNMTESEFDRLAEQVALAGDMPQKMLTELRKAAPVPKFADAFDVKTVTDFQNERVCIELIAGAIQVTTRDIRKIRAKVAAQVVGATRPERERIGRQLASALVGLLLAVRAEHAFASDLQTQDEDLPGMLLPRIFAADVLSDPAIAMWLREAVAAGFVTPEDRSRIEALGVIPRAAVAV